MAQAAQIQRTVHAVNAGCFHFQVAHQDLHHIVRHLSVYLKADSVAKSPLPYRFLDAFQQIVRLQLLDGEIGIASYAEHMRLDNFQSRKQVLQVRHHQLLDGHKSAASRRSFAGQINGQELRNRIRNLYARKMLRPTRIADHHGHVQTEIRDMRKRPALIESQRCEHREDFVQEQTVQLHSLLPVHFGKIQQPDMRRRQLRRQLLPVEGVRLVHEKVHFDPDGFQGLGRTPAVDEWLLHFVLDLLHQSGHADHEEFVDIRTQNREELHPLQQGIAGIARFFQHPALEFQMAQFTIQVKGGIA